jgi:hypothetical protein
VRYSRTGNQWKAITIAGGTVLVLGTGLGVALADTNSSAGRPTIVCPDVQSKLPAVPDRARAEVDRNLALLTTQIAEANRRLSTSAGEGGPNFVPNAILGPLKDKRISTIDRIAIAIGRVSAKPAGLDALAPCALSGAETAPPPQAQPEPAPSSEGADGGAATGGNNGADGGSTAGGILCPTVADHLPAIPASAQAEVARNLTLLETQIAEADRRLATSAGEGGPNFVPNAILGPLKDKRVATINRIATAIGRTAAKPQGLDALAPCTLN